MHPVGLCSISGHARSTDGVGRVASDCAMELLQMRWHLHVPVNAFFVTVTLLQNSYVCRAAWPGVPGALPVALSPGEPGSIPARCAEAHSLWGLRLPLVIM